MIKNIKKYPVIKGLLLTVINFSFSLLLVWFMCKTIYWGFKEAGLGIIIFLGGPIFISFLLCFSIQVIYKIKQLENGFLFRVLCSFNFVELFFILLHFFPYFDSVKNMFLFVTLVLLLSMLKIISIRIYHFLYPRDKYRDSIQYLRDMWKAIFISVVIACVIIFLIILILSK